MPGLGYYSNDGTNWVTHTLCSSCAAEVEEYESLTYIGEADDEECDECQTAWQEE